MKYIVTVDELYEPNMHDLACIICHKKFGEFDLKQVYDDRCICPDCIGNFPPGVITEEDIKRKYSNLG